MPTPNQKGTVMPKTSVPTPALEDEVAELLEKMIDVLDYLAANDRLNKELGLKTQLPRGPFCTLEDIYEWRDACIDVLDVLALAGSGR